MDDTRLSLLQRLRTPGDKDAWEDFVMLYEPLLFAYVRSKNVPPSDAADVVQTIYISLLRALPTFQLDRSRGRFRSWLYQVTMRAVIDWARKRQRRARREVGLREKMPEPAVFDPRPDEGWEQAYRERMFQAAAAAVRAETNEKTWACFQAHLLEGRASEVVAGELGMLPNTVRKNASRVLARVSERAQANALEMEP
jgi:RNA polymerase sigma-70 factor (ECF subfamily)